MSTDRILDLMALMREIERPHATYTRAVRRAAETFTGSAANERAQARGNAALLEIEQAVRQWVAEHPAAVSAPVQPPVSRADGLREAIDVAREEGHRLEAEQGIEVARGARSVAYLLRRLLAKDGPRRMAGEEQLAQKSALYDAEREKRPNTPPSRMRSLADEEQPATEAQALVHVGWYCWRGDGHLADSACRSDNVPIHVPAEWADDMRAEITRKSEDDDEQPAAVVRGDDRIVAYRDPNWPRVLLCREHGERWAGVVPVTAEELPDGGICTFGRLGSYECGRDVLIPEPPR